MNSPNDPIAAAIEASSRMFLGFSEDLKDSDWTHRVCENAVPAAWIIGHLILSCRGMMQRCGMTEFPALPDGFEKRFARDESAPRASDYGDTTLLRPLFQTFHQRAAEFVKTLSPEKLSEKFEKPHPMFSSIGMMLAFMPLHIAMHAGQISTIRRTLGRPPII